MRKRKKGDVLFQATGTYFVELFCNAAFLKILPLKIVQTLYQNLRK